MSQTTIVETLIQLKTTIHYRNTHKNDMDVTPFEQCIFQIVMVLNAWGVYVYITCGASWNVVEA